MNNKSKDAHSFVDGVVRYLKTEQGSASFLPKVESLLGKMSSHDKKERTAYVASVCEFTDQQKITMAKILEALVDHPIQVVYKLEPTLLGGVKVQLGDLVVDTSLSAQLDRIGETLKKN